MQVDPSADVGVVGARKRSRIPALLLEEDAWTVFDSKRAQPEHSDISKPKIIVTSAEFIITNQFCFPMFASSSCITRPEGLQHHAEKALDRDEVQRVRTSGATGWFVSEFTLSQVPTDKGTSMWTT